MRRLVAFMVLLLLYAGICKAALRQMTVDDNGLYGVQAIACYRSLYPALAYGASVYECVLIDYTVRSRHDTALMVRTVRLSVVRVLCGEKRQQLVLPCSFLQASEKWYGGDYFKIWPNLIAMPSARHLCVVVVPHAYDRSVGIDLKREEVPAAASHVFEGSDAAEAPFGWVERICGLQAMGDGDDGSKRLAALSHATLDPDGGVRVYAEDALVGDYLDTRPIEVIHAWRDEVAQATLTWSAAERVLARIREMARDSTAPLACRQEAVRALASLINPKVPALVRLLAVQNLSSAVADKYYDPPNRVVIRAPAPPPLPFGAIEVLTVAERARLREALAAVKNERGAVESVRVNLQWLDAPSTVSQTRPAADAANAVRTTQP